MPETHSRDGKRVEQFVVTDNPHERYRTRDPWTNKRLDNGIPILKSTDVGNVVIKEIKYSIVNCPECGIPARYTAQSEPVCPNCGMICTGMDTTPKEDIIRDAKAAGRINGNNNETTA